MSRRRLVGVAQAQTITPLANKPGKAAGICFLLTDGTVMVQAGDGASWLKLTPDINGSYVNGTWTVSSRASPRRWNYQPSAFSSAVLADGRLVVLGGEYNAGAFALTNLGAIYDPVNDKWAKLAAPAGWDYIGDSPSSMLPGGQFLVGNKLTKEIWPCSTRPRLRWTALASTHKSDFNAEEGWTLLPDGSILTTDVKDAPNTERYIPSKQKWMTAGATPVPLNGPPAVGSVQYGGGVYHPPGEVGPQILRPDGTVFATGALTTAGTAHTAIYTPGAGWTAGPDFPNGDDAGDSSAGLLPSGNVLVVGTSGTLYEFDGTHFTPGPTDVGGFLMMLPSGEILITPASAPRWDSKDVSVYTSTGAPNPAWAPTITERSPLTVTRGPDVHGHLGHAVQRPLPGRRGGRRVPDRDQLPRRPADERRDRARLLREDARPLDHGRRHGQRAREHVLRRPGRRRDRRDRRRGRGQRHPVAGDEDQGPVGAKRPRPTGRTS